jgi:hypothetical protein
MKHLRGAFKRIGLAMLLNVHAYFARGIFLRFADGRYDRFFFFRSKKTPYGFFIRH